MKLYVDYRVKNENCEIGFTLYSKTGSILYTDVQISKRTENKLLPTLKSMMFGLNRVKQLLDNGLIPMDKILIFTRSKIIYNWFESRSPSDDYKVEFDDILFKIDWIPVELELIHTQSIGSKVKYKKQQVEQKTFSLNEILGVTNVTKS